jgi:mono/diheme cytochrome c family protein
MEGAMRVSTLWWGATIVLASALALVDAPVQAQTYSGGGDYQVYCASCHGSEARGDGVIAKSLKKRPADLTRLSRRNNGLFPEQRVFATIDGRQPDSAHSASDMPAWADVFAKSSGSAGADNAAARIDALVKYLQTLQEK